MKRFADAGLVEVVGTDADRGPSRTTYRVTAAGRDALADLTRQAWIDRPRWSFDTDLALLLVTLDWMGSPILGRSELQELLGRRVTALESVIDELGDTAEETMSMTELALLRELQRAHFDHGLALLRAELEWTRAVESALRSGHFDIGPE